MEQKNSSQETWIQWNKRLPSMEQNTSIVPKTCQGTFVRAAPPCAFALVCAHEAISHPLRRWPGVQGIGPATANARSGDKTSPFLGAPSPVAMWTSGNNLTFSSWPSTFLPRRGPCPVSNIVSRPTSIYYVFNFICNVIAIAFM
jgi:hypothetical protein